MSSKIINYSELRSYLKDNLKLDCLRSLFIAGSVKEEFSGGSDIDIFVIIYEDKLNSFLDDLTQKMNKFIEDNPSFIYSYFRGPIKFEEKILLHFVIYTDNPDKPKKVEDFQNEPPQVFEGILKRYDLISGEDPINLKGEMNLDEPSREEREEYMKKKAEYFFKEDIVKYSEWKKENKEWKFISSQIKLSSWQKEHLEKYFHDYKQ